MKWLTVTPTKIWRSSGQQKGQFWSPSVSNLSTLYLLWSLLNSMYYKMD